MQIVVITKSNKYLFEDYFEAMKKYKAFNSLGLKAEYKIQLD